MDSDYSDSDQDLDNNLMSEDDEDYGFDPTADAIYSSQKTPYRILGKNIALDRRKEALSRVTAVLGITDDEATKVLRKFKWDANRVHEEWFADMDAVRAAVGLTNETSTPSSPSATERCNICFETFQRNSMLSTGCPHSYCKTCWLGYISTAISNGRSCLDLRCPAPGCKTCVLPRLVKEVVSGDDWNKYQAFSLQSFIEDNKSMSWCTGANCENVVECLVDRAPEEPLDIVCSCGSTFCFNCKEESHRPVACDTVRQWIVKNSAESENLNWILANTKPCPKCYRPIEKNQGCMHMTCSQCKHEFCWLCNGTWQEHGERTGGFYACNRYEVAKKRGDYDDETKRRDNAKQSLERYMHYFERWDAHNKAREKARADALKTEHDIVPKLSDMYKTPTSQLKWIAEAWHQIIECRRMLKWTYAYGYYMYMDDTTTSVQDMERRREFFEFLQWDAEKSLESLHDKLEKDLKNLLPKEMLGPPGCMSVVRPPSAGSAGAAGSSASDPQAFSDFRKQLIGLTDVTRSFFDKLIKQLEKGFEELEQN